jgi:hypothetical protein
VNLPRRRNGEPRRVHYFGFVCVLFACWLTIINPIGLFFVVVYTWQSTMIWCMYRYIADGRNVWDSRKRTDDTTS